MKRVYLLVLVPFCLGLMGMESCFPGDGTDVDDSGNDAFGTNGHGPALSYTDNGNGTFTDNNTGDMWEIKTNVAGSVHNVNNTYTWAAAPGGIASDGTLFTDFLDTLNHKCDGDETTACASDADCGFDGPCGFAGHRDWCIPHIKGLDGIVDYSMFNPASSVPGETAASDYRSSTTPAPAPSTRGSSISSMASCSTSVSSTSATLAQYAHARDWSFDHLIKGLRG